MAIYRQKGPEKDEITLSCKFIMSESYPSLFSWFLTSPLRIFLPDGLLTLTYLD